MTVIIIPDEDGPDLKQLIAAVGKITGERVTTNGSGVVVSEAVARQYLSAKLGKTPAAQPEQTSAATRAGAETGGVEGSSGGDSSTPAKKAEPPAPQKSTPAKKAAPVKKATPAKKTTAAAAQRTARRT